MKIVLNYLKEISIIKKLFFKNKIIKNNEYYSYNQMFLNTL